MRLHKTQHSYCLFITSLSYYASGCLGGKSSALIGFGVLCKLSTVNWLPKFKGNYPGVCVCSQTQRSSCCIRSRQTLIIAHLQNLIVSYIEGQLKPLWDKVEMDPGLFFGLLVTVTLCNARVLFSHEAKRLLWAVAMLCVWMGILSMVQPRQCIGLHCSGSAGAMSDIGGYFNVVCMHESIHPADVFGRATRKGKEGGWREGKRRGNRQREEGIVS